MVFIDRLTKYAATIYQMFWDQNDFCAMLWFKKQFSSQESYFWLVILNSVSLLQDILKHISMLTENIAAF